jgi:hypothetical protein
LSFNHEAVAALPAGANADAAAIRAMCERRFAYTLAASESATDFVAVDPVSGVIPLYLIQNSTLFAYDAADSTTTHDGVTCLVSFEGKRFKSGVIQPPYSVLDKDLVAQPASPAVGDTYLIPTAATGTDWAGKDGKIGIYTAAGWRFAISPIGRELYVRDEDAKYYRNSAGTWTAGVGSIPLAANSVKITNILGAKASYVIKVENQTTNAPPASPVAPVAYIIGSSPTGAWAGNAGKLAVCLVTGTFTLITPDEGDEVYDKTLNNVYRFNGTAWVSAAGAMARYKSQFSASAINFTSGGSGIYTYSHTSPPSSHTFDQELTFGIAWAASVSGATLEFTYQARFGFTGAGDFTFALMRDAETFPVDWLAFYIPTGSVSQLVMFRIAASDTSTHTYTLRIYRPSGVSTNGAGRILFKVEEFAI